jgi:hypothetical protein
VKPRCAALPLLQLASSLEVAVEQVELVGGGADRTLDARSG